MSRRWKWRVAVYTMLAVALGGGSLLVLQWAGRPIRRDGLDVIPAGTPPEAVDRMLADAGVTKDDVVYDLGCGDARFLVAAAKRYGCRAVGVELDAKELAKARRNVAENGVEHLVEIREGDLFEVDLRPATVLTIYLLPDLNVKLIPQLKQMRPGSRIVSYLFDMQGKVKPTKTVQFKDSAGYDRTYHLWVTPLAVEGG